MPKLLVAAGPLGDAVTGVQQGGGGEAEEDDGGKPSHSQVIICTPRICSHFFNAEKLTNNSKLPSRSLRLTQLSASQEELRRYISNPKQTTNKNTKKIKTQNNPNFD